MQIVDDGHCCSGNFSDRYPNLTYPQWDQIRRHQQAFSDIFAWGDQAFNLANGGEVHLGGLWVSGDYFHALGVRAAAGRLLTADDDRPGCGSPGVVISHRFWQSQFGSGAQAIGAKLSLDPVEVGSLGPLSWRPSGFGCPPRQALVPFSLGNPTM